MLLFLLVFTPCMGLLVSFVDVRVKDGVSNLLIVTSLTLRLLDTTYPFFSPIDTNIPPSTVNKKMVLKLHLKLCAEHPIELIQLNLRPTDQVLQQRSTVIFSGFTDQ